MVMLLPSVTRVVEEVLRVVPGGLREASLALGAPQWRTVWSVVLPTARSGVVTAILLGYGPHRGRDRSAALHRVRLRGHQLQPVRPAQGALPLDVCSNVHAGQSVTIELAFQAAFVLMAIVLILFVAARFFGRTKGKRKHAASGEDDIMARFFVPVPMEGEESNDCRHDGRLG